MKRERLFRILGLIDDGLIEEASSVFTSDPPRKQRFWMPALAAAACVALICAVTVPTLFQGGGSKSEAPAAEAAPKAEEPAAPGGNSGSGINKHKSETESDVVTDNEPLSVEGTQFMSYAGPVFPLTLSENTEGLTAERTTVWDFTAGTYQDDSPRQWGAEVSDSYLLMNHTDGEILAMVCYPYAGSLADVDTQLPAMTVNGVHQAADFAAGAYAGGFRDAGLNDGSTWNLDQPHSWTDYKALLEDGSYLAGAMEETNALAIPVTVYTFTDYTAPAAYDAATQAIEFTADPEKTTVLTYGFNGKDWNEETGWQRHSFFVPNGNRRSFSPRMLIVVGEDIGAYNLCGYEDGGCDPREKLPGVNCTVTRCETTLDAVIAELCAAYAAESSWHLGLDGESVFEILTPQLYQEKVTELLLQHGIFAGNNTKDRYAEGRLDDIFAETLTQSRVLYLTAEVAIPAGETVDITFNLCKEPSFDFGCSGSEHVGLQGYDYVTTLGSNLSFTSLTAKLVNTDGIEITGGNFGFDPAAGITEVELDPQQEHYYLEIREIR